MSRVKMEKHRESGDTLTFRDSGFEDLEQLERLLFWRNLFQDYHVLNQDGLGSLFKILYQNEDTQYPPYETTLLNEALKLSQDCLIKFLDKHITQQDEFKLKRSLFVLLAPKFDYHLYSCFSSCQSRQPYQRNRTSRMYSSKPKKEGCGEFCQCGMVNKWKNLLPRYVSWKELFDKLSSVVNKLVILIVLRHLRKLNEKCEVLARLLIEIFLEKYFFSYLVSQDQDSILRHLEVALKVPQSRTFD